MMYRDEEGKIIEPSRGAGVFFMPVSGQHKWGEMINSEEDPMINVGSDEHHYFNNVDLDWSPTRNVSKSSREILNFLYNGDFCPIGQE